MTTKVGDIVLFHSEIDKHGTVTKVDWPAIVYKIYEGEIADPVGLTVFFEGIPVRYGKVCYSTTARNECWRRIDY